MSNADITRLPARRDAAALADARPRSPAVVNFLNNYDATQQENEDLRTRLAELEGELREARDSAQAARRGHETEAELLRAEVARLTQERDRFQEGYTEMKAHVEGLQIQATQALVVSRRKMEALGIAPRAPRDMDEERDVRKLERGSPCG